MSSMAWTSLASNIQDVSWQYHALYDHRARKRCCRATVTRPPLSCRRTTSQVPCYGLLEPFQRAGIMLTRIDTRPSRSEAWTYLFFMEFEGHHSQSNVQSVLAELEEHTVMLKLLGSYPQAVI